MKKLLWLLWMLPSLVFAGSNDVLHIYNWSGSLSDKTVRDFEKSCQCRLVQDLYGDNEEMLAKLAAGGSKGYDMVFPSSSVIQSVLKLKLLQPLDHSKILNLKNINPVFIKASYDSTARYSIPTVLSLTSVGYNVERLQKLGIDPHSWSVVFDPNVLKKIRGRVSILDNAHEVFAAALFYLGKNPNKATEADYRAAADVLKKAKPYWAMFSNASYQKELAVGNIWVSLGYSTEIFQASEDARLAKRPFRIANVVQREGNELGIDTMTIMANAKRPDLAHRFINFMLEGKNAAQLTNINGAINPVSTAVPYFRADLKANPLINPSKQAIQKWLVLRELTPKERRLVNRLWTEVKVSR